MGSVTIWRVRKGGRREKSEIDEVSERNFTFLLPFTSRSQEESRFWLSSIGISLLFHLLLFGLLIFVTSRERVVNHTAPPRIFDVSLVTLPEIETKAVSEGKLNLERELEAMELQRPVLAEGTPGPNYHPSSVIFEELVKPKLPLAEGLDAKNKFAGPEQLAPLSAEGLNVSDSAQMERTEVPQVEGVSVSDFEEVREQEPILAEGLDDKSGFERPEQLASLSTEGMNVRDSVQMERAEVAPMEDLDMGASGQVVKPKLPLAEGLDAKGELVQPMKLEQLSEIEKQVENFQSASLGADFEPKKMGGIRPLCEVKSTPVGARIFVDGSFKGRAPLKLDLPAGKYEVRVSLENHYAWEAQLIVPIDGRIPPIFVRLVPKDQ